MREKGEVLSIDSFVLSSIATTVSYSIQTMSNILPSRVNFFSSDFGTLNSTENPGQPVRLKMIKQVDVGFGSRRCRPFELMQEE